jgi:hypothetical protein
MASMTQSKNIDYHIGLKDKTQPVTHLVEKIINTGLESKSGKKFSKEMDPINKQE